MKFSKILTTAFVALGATIALSGCIRETFPKESTITQEQLGSVAPDVLAENLLKVFLVVCSHQHMVVGSTLTSVFLQ
jgi:hypothetical protein